MLHFVTETLASQLPYLSYNFFLAHSCVTLCAHCPWNTPPPPCHLAVSSHRGLPWPAPHSRELRWLHHSPRWLLHVSHCTLDHFYITAVTFIVTKCPSPVRGKFVLRPCSSGSVVCNLFVFTHSFENLMKTINFPSRQSSLNFYR